MARQTEAEIQSAYEGREAAADYVQKRFESWLMALLHEAQVEEVNRIMRAEQPARTLELAPGPGRVTRDVVPSGELMCLEYNEGMIEEGRAATGEPVIWRQGNAFELPFQDEFEFLYSFRFIRHFRRADRDRLYREIAKALRPGGLLTFDAVNGEVSRPLREASPQAYPIYDKLYDDEQALRTELAEAGFEVLRVRPVQRWYSLQYRIQVLVGPRSSRLCRLLIRAAESLRKGPALEWVVTCRYA